MPAYSWDACASCGGAAAPAHTIKGLPGEYCSDCKETLDKQQAPEVPAKEEKPVAKSRTRECSRCGKVSFIPGEGMCRGCLLATRRETAEPSPPPPPPAAEHEKPEPVEEPAVQSYPDHRPGRDALLAGMTLYTKKLAVPKGIVCIDAKNIRFREADTRAFGIKKGLAALIYHGRNRIVLEMVEPGTPWAVKFAQNGRGGIRISAMGLHKTVDIPQGNYPVRQESGLIIIELAEKAA